MTNELVKAPCPVCQHSVAVQFFNGGAHPLATLGWPSSKEDAQEMPRHPHDFVQCPSCTHVWNRSFSYDAIPYQNNPNRMYNKGCLWKGHLAKTRDLLMDNLGGHPTVIDVGCGEGHFVRGLSESYSAAGRFIGFDPSTAAETGQGVEFYAKYFEPLEHMREFSPDAVVIRHVLEHLTNPSAILDELAWGSMTNSKGCWLFAEVPCIDRVMKTGRLADFFYEHTSHFTTESFRRLMERAGTIMELGHGYDGEVVYALVQIKTPNLISNAMASTTFCNEAEKSRANIQAQLDDMHRSGARVAIWGGTGKAAAFMHQFNADAERFPLVVDSDPEKAGTFVPGTGQQIQYRDVLKGESLDFVIIPTQWRARDIEAEILREGIVARDILIEHKGSLISLRTGSHPYK